MSEWQRENIMILCNSLNMKGKVRKTDYLEKGSTPVVDQSESFIAGYTDDKAVFSDPPYILFGDHTRIIKFIDFPFSPGKLIQLLGKHGSVGGW